ncbi:type IV pilin protein [Ectothiorhodospira variabilis]|uniref:type IV pilin protein n=1 Tax=Ectothiorhodospira variabilis TaxID=505694 RepID=UPI001EFC24D8|nr:type IV pilin protein [Ectothiorhodospira variabilis]MCG5493544.1 type IV pilin protein [Ectothiorhodospira variabilis]MCG5502873.1 type IV pilin protein [Ectothiorhodospira variabilis]MCG5506339.1 type IV pilin protein [Ectothiorhodospira variabilis]
MKNDRTLLTLQGTRSIQTAGFTLIEVMITVAIIGILAAIAYPSYQHYVTNTNRGAAQACLHEHAQFMERYYTSNMTYEDAAPNPGCVSNVDNAYTFSVTSGSSTYTVTATPIGAQAQRDSKCGALTLNQRGERGAAGDAGVSGCW